MPGVFSGGQCALADCPGLKALAVKLRCATTRYLKPKCSADLLTDKYTLSETAVLGQVSSREL